MAFYNDVAPTALAATHPELAEYIFREILFIDFYPRKRAPITAMAKTSKAAKKKRTPSAAFMKPVTPDDKLAQVVGPKPLPRTELTKQLWVYIRKHGLQDKKVRTQINADENLKAVFNGKKSVSMFEMTKLVSRHLKK
jgi:chromatin remodeling complex protein RSC6